MKDKKINNIELLHFLKELKTVNSQVDLPEGSYDGIVNHVHELIGQSQDTIRKRIDGLNKEDEFLLYSLLLGNILQVTRLDQKNYNNNKIIIPDFLFAVNVPEEMNNENQPMVQRFFVEVKKMRKGEDEFVISLKYLKKIKSYAELYGFPLYFAIKMDNRHPVWFLVFVETFEEHGKIEDRKINNRFEKCFVIDGVKLLKYDYSGLWLSNYLLIVPTGLKIDTTFNKDTSNQNSGDEVINVIMRYGEGFKEGLFEELVLDSIFLKICNYLKSCNNIEGCYQVQREENGKIVKWETNIDFYIFYHHLILTCYLYIKNELEKDNLNKFNNIPYYLKTFSDFDNTIVIIIKSIINEIAHKKMLIPIINVPNNCTEILL